MLGDKGIGLSLGQIQRIGIALALYWQKPIIIFDESTSSLDPQNEKEIMNDIKKLKGKKTIIIISHKKEVLDKNTEEGVKRRDDEIKKRLQRKETEAIRHKQEILFNSKIEAFEISTIKNSTNMELKRKIRKAKSPMEVAAYTTILLLDDFMNEKSVTDLWDETPSLVQKLKEVAEVVYDEKDKS